MIQHQPLDRAYTRRALKHQLGSTNLCPDYRDQSALTTKSVAAESFRRDFLFRHASAKSGAPQPPPWTTPHKPQNLEIEATYIATLYSQVWGHQSRSNSSFSKVVHQPATLLFLFHADIHHGQDPQVELGPPL